MTLYRQVAAEGIGTALLLAVVVGSGIMGERLAGGNAAIVFTASIHERSGVGQWVSEDVATAGLLLTIWLARHKGAIVVGGLVAAYITAAYGFTASTSFANPAVTLGSKVN